MGRVSGRDRPRERPRAVTTVACAARASLGRVLLCAAAALAVVGAALGVAPGRAAADEGADGYFSDDNGSVHEPALDALASRDVLAGTECGQGLICPSRSVTRGQMASFLARALGLIELPASVRFTAIDTGSGHSCGLRADRTIVCWGANDHGQARAPEGQFSVVSAGWKHSCAVRMDGTVACWGSYAYDRSRQPEGRFKTVSVGFHASCGVRVDGTVDCWEAGWHDAADAPVKTGVLDGRFTTVSVGHHHACGLRSNGEIDCWGDNDSSQVDAPSGRFLEVGAEDCTAADFESTEPLPAGAPPQSAGPYRAAASIAVGFDHGCGLGHHLQGPRREIRSSWPLRRAHLRAWRGLDRCWGRPGSSATGTEPTTPPSCAGDAYIDRSRHCRRAARVVVQQTESQTLRRAPSTTTRAA